MSIQDDISRSVSGSGARRVGDRIELPRGVIDLVDTLTVASSVSGMHLTGRGPATAFRWLGPSDRPVFSFVDGNGCGLSDVSVDLVTRAETLVEMKDSGGGPIRSSNNLLRNIVVPDAGGKLGTFWHIGGGADQKNDFMRGELLDISGCEVGLWVEGRNALNHELYGCQFKGRADGKTGVRTDGGSVRMFGGSINQFRHAAFDVGTRNGVALAAYGVHVEGCGRLITAAKPRPGDISSSIVVMDAVRWGSPSGDVSPDGEIIAYSGGTLVVRGCWFGTGTPKATSYRFRYETTQTFGDFVFEDCRVRAANASGHWPGQGPRSLAGSLLYVGTSNAPQPMPPKSVTP